MRRSDATKAIGNICSARDRRIMRMWLLDGVSQEKIAEIVDMSPRQIWTIVHDTAGKMDKQLH